MTSNSSDSSPEQSEIKTLKEQIKVLQAKLAQFEEQEQKCRAFEVVASNTSNSVLIVDPEGNAMWVNPSFEKLSGLSGAEIIGKPTSQFLMGPDTKLETVQKICCLLYTSDAADD